MDGDRVERENVSQDVRVGSAARNLCIKGAREHNLKNIDVMLPRDALVVISGLSGSGKSSLAFDTIFAEGQRRYVESLSAYARQFLGRLDKPDVDSIEGLSPAIAIEQKTTQRNPRSTVGTVTEIYDYYRLLFARIGRAHCPHCAREIKEQTVDQIVDTLMTVPSGSRIQLLAPVVRGKKGTHHKVLEAARKDGFVRARIDGALLHLHERISLDKQKKHSIDIVVDRIQLSDTVRKRLTESVETTLGYADGLLTVLVQGENSGTVSGKIETSALLPSELFFSQKNACAHCNVSVPELQPRLFSFNAPFGACPSCAGLVIMQTFDLDRIVPDQNRSFNEGAFLPFKPEH